MCQIPLLENPASRPEAGQHFLLHPPVSPPPPPLGKLAKPWTFFGLKKKKLYVWSGAVITTLLLLKCN